MNEQPRIDPEFKALIPPLTEDEYQQLEQNILTQRRCNDAILLWNGTIVDGFNRFCICVTHGIEFSFEEVQFPSREDAKVWIIENQLGRRNLCDAARIELAMCKAELLREKARQNQSRAGIDRHRAGQLLPLSSKLAPEETVNLQRDIANEAGISKGKLVKYQQIKKSNNLELLEKVKTGELKIGTAHRLLTPEIERQLKDADKLYTYIEERLPFEDEAVNAKIHEDISKLANQLRTLIEKIGGEHA